MSELTLPAHFVLASRVTTMYNEMGEVMKILGNTTDRKPRSVYQTGKKLDMQIEALQRELQEQLDTHMDPTDKKLGNLYQQGIDL